ncbi:RHS repeat-associated core domain-containing protein [Arthrobacter sp. zg-Y40]|uniref:RHS repeat-associated core domain-containing protein n=1 Tax=Arthrobacter sp. zg-Y40 TaxID=2886939 RepID=UPI003FA43730
MKYGQRWYNPGVGRWTQMDTLDAPLDLANANRYAYVANDPINNSDPLGMLTDDQKNDLGANITCGVGFGILGLLSPPVGIAGIAICTGVTIYTTIDTGED